jgi:hypothetical protein
MFLIGLYEYYNLDLEEVNKNVNFADLTINLNP